jgi:hypothetical protein
MTTAAAPDFQIIIINHSPTPGAASCCVGNQQKEGLTMTTTLMQGEIKFFDPADVEPARAALAKAGYTIETGLSIYERSRMLDEELGNERPIIYARVASVTVLDWETWWKTVEGLIGEYEAELDSVGPMKNPSMDEVDRLRTIGNAALKQAAALEKMLRKQPGSTGH